MDTKKLIGAIIGVTAFAALIAGATFAWLSSTANVTNSVFTGISKNFIITYSGSSAVSGFKQIPSGSATTAAITTATSAAVVNDAWAAVTASKTANDAPASSFKIKLAIDTNIFTTSAVTWAICKNACPTGVALATVSSGVVTCGSGVTNCGSVPANSLTEIVLYNDTVTFNTDAAVSATTYNVYFWLDDATVSNTDLDVDHDSNPNTPGVPASFSGYIYAEATQAD